LAAAAVSICAIPPCTSSGTFSPTLGKSIALARLPLGTRPGDSVKVLVRDKPLAARVVKPPFARHGKVL
jgi:aminomethyltransferase